MGKPGGKTSCKRSLGHCSVAVEQKLGKLLSRNWGNFCGNWKNEVLTALCEHRLCSILLNIACLCVNVHGQVRRLYVTGMDDCSVCAWKNQLSSLVWSPVPHGLNSLPMWQFERWDANVEKDWELSFECICAVLWCFDVFHHTVVLVHLAGCRDLKPKSQIAKWGKRGESHTISFSCQQGQSKTKQPAVANQTGFWNILFFMQESGLYGEAARASLSSGTEKLARIGHGNHASRDFWRFAQLPVVSWIDIIWSVPRMDCEFQKEHHKF